MSISDAPISVRELRTVVRSTIAGAARGPVTIEEVTRHTNLNYVFRVVVGETTLFVKAIPPRLKRFGVELPQSRMFDEVRAMQIVREQSQGAVVVPEIAFVDEHRFLIGMTDVSGGRTLAADAVDPDDTMLVGAARALGVGLANIHTGTRGIENLRSPSMDATIRGTIFGYLVVPPPELEDARAGAMELMAEVRVRADCLVHGDLWPKNIFVGEGVAPAIIDLEGALMGDPAFDLATICAASLLPTLEAPALVPRHVDAVRRFLGTYQQQAADRGWAREASGRALRLMGVLVAVRTFGATAFPMSNAARARALAVARRLLATPPAGDDYRMEM